MTTWSSRSLHGRLLQHLLLVTVLAVAAGAALTLALARHYSDRIFDAWLTDTTESLADVVGSDADFNDSALREAIAQQVRYDATDTVAFMVRGPHQLIAGRQLPPPPLMRRHRGAQLYDATLDGHAVRIAYVTTQRANGEAVEVGVAETLLKRRIVASEVLATALIPALLLAILASLLISRGVDRALLPLDTISREILTRDPLNLHPLPDSPLSEIRPLIDAVNDLLKRLNLALDAQRSFVADTAHQLRNPLAGIKLQLEEALRDGAPMPRSSLQRLLASVDRASRLAAQLLSLARAEAEATLSDSPIETIDLERFAADVGREWAPRLLREGLQIQLDPPPAPVLARGRPLLLAEALDNLLHNALRHAGRGAQVRLIVASAGDEAWLTVADDGPGFAPTIRAQLFRRFARGDHSSGEGAGLGLAIVRELMRAQQGDADVVPPPGERGAAIRLRLRSVTAGDEAGA